MTLEKFEILGVKHDQNFGNSVRPYMPTSQLKRKYVTARLSGIFATSSHEAIDYFRTIIDWTTNFKMAAKCADLKVPWKSKVCCMLVLRQASKILNKCSKWCLLQHGMFCRNEIWQSCIIFVSKSQNSESALVDAKRSACHMCTMLFSFLSTE